MFDSNRVVYMKWCM